MVQELVKARLFLPEPELSRFVLHSHISLYGNGEKANRGMCSISSCLNIVNSGIGADPLPFPYKIPYLTLISGLLYLSHKCLRAGPRKGEIKSKSRQSKSLTAFCVSSNAFLSFIQIVITDIEKNNVFFVKFKKNSIFAVNGKTPLIF